MAATSCGRRIEVEIRIEPIARLKYEFLPRLYTGDWLDRVNVSD